MKKIIIFLVVFAFLINPVSAEIINYDVDYSGSGSLTISANGGALNYNIPYNKLWTSDVSNFIGVKSMIMGCTGVLPSVPSGYTSAASAQTDFTAKIGSTIVGHGVFGWNQHIVGGSRLGMTIFAVFDDLDVSAYSGEQTITLYLDDTGILPTVKSYNSVSAAKTGDAPSVFFGQEYGVYTYRAVGNLAIYLQKDFHQKLEYTFVDNVFDIHIYKNNVNNWVKITSPDDVNLLYTDSADDIIQTYYGYEYLNITVNNPFDDDPWFNQIPETSTPTVPDTTAMIHSYVYDAVTRELINNGHNVTVNYGSGSSSDTYWPGSISHTTIDWSDESSANVTYSADGYETSPATTYVASVLDSSGSWLQTGSEVDAYVWLNPLETPSNTTAWVTFEVQEQMSTSSPEHYFYSEEAAVAIGNTTLLTGGLGTCTFELPAGTYSYTVKKTGYQTTSGTFSLGASNQYIGVDLPLMPSAPTPTGEPGVEYTYSPEDYREKADEAATIFTSMLPMWASLAAVVLTMSLIGWITPKKRR